MQTPPIVPRQRTAPGAAAPAAAQVVDIDAEVFAASRLRPALSLDCLDEHAVSVLVGVLLDARAGLPGSEARGLRGEALVHHFVSASAPADLIRHGRRVGRMVRALPPRSRAELLDALGAVGTPRRTVVERLTTEDDPTARAYAAWCSPSR